MNWKDEGYLLSKNNFNENSVIIEAITLEHGKYSGVVYGGSARKLKKDLQIGNKLLLNMRSKNDNKMGYFNLELLKPISPMFFDDKERSICILSSSAILKILLPERQINKKIYLSFENFLSDLKSEYWITQYIYWELFLIKELGFEMDFFNSISKNAGFKKNIELNGKYYKIPDLFLEKRDMKFSNQVIKEALVFNKSLLMENFISPNHLKIPVSRNLLENYY
jgi:DNA repair protein RecO (recombination protein O)